MAAVTARVPSVLAVPPPSSLTGRGLELVCRQRTVERDDLLLLFRQYLRQHCAVRITDLGPGLISDSCGFAGTTLAQSIEHFNLLVRQPQRIDHGCVLCFSPLQRCFPVLSGCQAALLHPCLALLQLVPLFLSEQGLDLGADRLVDRFRLVPHFLARQVAPSKLLP